MMRGWRLLPCSDLKIDGCVVAIYNCTAELLCSRYSATDSLPYAVSWSAMHAIPSAWHITSHLTCTYVRASIKQQNAGNCWGYEDWAYSHFSYHHFSPLKPNSSKSYTLPYRPNLPFLISDIRVLWCSNVRNEIKNGRLGLYGAEHSKYNHMIT